MAGNNCAYVLASCRTERLLTTVAKVYVARGRCLLQRQKTISYQRKGRYLQKLVGRVERSDYDGYV